MMRTHLPLTITLFVAASAWVVGVGIVRGDEAIDFARDVLPILQSHCLECHGSEARESKLRLDSMLDALRGGDSGEPTIVPGDSRRSHVIERLTTTDTAQRMPPDAEPLSTAEMSIIRRWIDDPNLWIETQHALSQHTSTHWSFRPISQAVLPHGNAHHPIDAFVQQQLTQAGLTMSPPAAGGRLIRRLFLVMHGLPPTPQQVDEFLGDQRADAWERLVDRVLESPRYGERWATHWLDLIHFGETNGFETNRERPNAFHFRDWVVQAFNNDKPYDQFIKQQIAGDAYGEPIGTGFLVAGPNDIVKGQDALLGLTQRQDELTDIVNTTGTAFLGLTTGCARCHNHKFDPISQADFYAMQAVFAGVEHAERELPMRSEVQQQLDELDTEIETLRQRLSQIAPNRLREKVSPRQNTETLVACEAKVVRFTILATNSAEPCIDELQIFSHNENVALSSAGARARSSGDFVHPLHKLEHINDGKLGNPHSWIASSATDAWVEIELPTSRTIERITWGRDGQGKFTDRVAVEYRIEVSADRAQWKEVVSSKQRVPFAATPPLRDLIDLTALTPRQAESASNCISRLETLEKNRLQLQAKPKVYAGSFREPDATYRLYRGDPTAPREEVAPGAIEVLGRLQLNTAAGERARRVALADWIAREDHPLTARVIVNRLWQFHFGAGIVDTPSDFGANGAPPTHPQLLDWLASELIVRHWSLKQLHRLLLTSQTWQQDSRPRDKAMRVDAASRLLWRFPPRRLEAEAIRDCILATSDAIDLSIGGPGFSAFQIDYENVRHYFPKKEYGPADWRRMLYMTKVRQEKDSTFGVFDCPDGSQVTPKRSRSTTPLQALNLLNSLFVNQQAEMLARRVCRDAATMPEQIVRAYALCFGRAPDATEAGEAAMFIERHGWQQCVRAMLNANEFVFIP